ncbi:hypothetical protein D3C71_1692390 [compost metagenome]
MCDRVAVIQNGKLVDLQEISMLKNEGGLAHVQYEVNDVAGAQQLLKELYPHIELLPAEGFFEAIVEREQIPLIIEALVKQGFKVYGVKATVKTLEDKFLEMTGSGQIG